MNGLMTISTISDYRVLLEEVFEEFVQEYQLDHGGAWLEFDIENNAFCIFEAPKQLKVRFMFELYDFILDYPEEEFKKLSEQERKEELADALRGHFLHAVSELDIDDYFDEKWSPEFGRENYLRPSQYIKQLQEDKAYLIQIYHEIVGQ